VRLSVKLPIAMNDSPLSDVPIHRSNAFCMSSLVIMLITEALNL